MSEFHTDHGMTEKPGFAAASIKLLACRSLI